MSDITFSMSADDKDVVRVLQNSGKEFGKLRDQIMSLATASNEQGKAEANLSQQRLAALAPIIAKQKELRSVMDDLGKQLKDGKLSQDQYNAAVKANADASDQLTQELRKLQTQVQEDTADMKKAAVVIGQVEDKTEKYARSVAELDRFKAKGIITSKQHAAALEAERKKLEDTGGAADKSGGLIGGLTGKMSSFVAGLSSAASVIAVLKAEYDALIERQGKSKDANLTLANQQEALLGNLGDADPQKLFGAIRQLAGRSAIKELDVTAAINEAMAARADLALSEVLAGVETAAKVRKFAPNELAGLSAAAIDTKKQTGLDMDQSMGFLMQMLPQSRVKSLKGVAENFTPAVGGLMQQGADRQTAAALLTTISHGMGDVTGERSRTAALGFGGQLRKLAPGQDLGATISQLQNDKAARDQFLSTATFEVAARPAIESLLSGGQQARQFAAAKQAFQEDPRKALERGIAARSASTAIGLAETDQAFGNIVNQQELADTRGAESAIVRARMKEIRTRMGSSALGATVDSALADFSTSGYQTTSAAVAELETKSRLLSQGKDDKTEFFRAGRGMATNPAQYDAMVQKNLQNPEFVKQAKLLEDMVALLRAQLDAQQSKTHAGAAAGRRNNQGEGAP